MAHLKQFPGRRISTGQGGRFDAGVAHLAARAWAILYEWILPLAIFAALLLPIYLYMRGENVRHGVGREPRVEVEGPVGRYPPSGDPLLVRSGPVTARYEPPPK